MAGPNRTESDTSGGGAEAERTVPDDGRASEAAAGDGEGAGDGAALADPTTVFGRAGRALVPGPVRRNYALKFAVAMLVVILLITVVGGGSYLQIRGIIETDAENTLQSTATLQADSVSEWMAGMRAQVRGYAGSDVFASSDGDRIEDALESSLAQASADVVGIHYVAPNGTIVASTAPGLAGLTVEGERPRWRDAVEDSAASRPGEWAVGTSDRAYENNGRWLTDPAGHRIVLRGVNLPGPVWGTEHAEARGKGYWETLDLATDADAGWHSRVLRIPATPQTLDNVGVEQFAADYLDEVVSHAAERGVYVLVDYHAVERYDTRGIDERLRAFWNVVAPRYADESHVLYELFNEPTEPASGGLDT